MFDIIYNFIDLILPFQWLSHNFMKNALLAILIVTPLFGILSTMVVSNKMSFFADSLGHGAFTGIALGILLGGIDPMWGATLFSICFAIAITIIKNKGTSSTDTIIGVFSSSAIALGLVLMSFSSSLSKFSSYLVGDLLSISKGEIVLLLFVFIIVIVLWTLIFNKLLITSLNTSLANSRGINTLLIEIIFTCTLAVIVTLTVRWVGLLIINSLLVLPAAAARNISKNVRQYHLFSVLIAVFSGITGLIVSYYLNTVTGATIVLISSLIFFITLILRRKFV
ncbi:metal ABC transporter permease [Clostridium celatum]|uniref:ABC 3 transport family protein n=1 Tax=Clostridium celatum DSM 1785 TaxID=545697 RepID=L1QLA3_9CLOT|nr:metal ABC transporter permease [Clostridium celatum]EKY28758.1 ABC 3 transport family protein [Clostridium celatum DSM 1785]MCE9655326.1 metal ABC transporter permease [Clostridium celatum]MDU2265636.1 metal ABC transporter permease [Clostridium celatum]MDU6295492.1 metal ABC transporter permease [Clostridium celatum]